MRIAVVCFLLTGLLVAAPGAGDTPGQRPAPTSAMHAGLQPAACRSCHASAKDSPKLINPARSCDAACTSCHSDMDRHHPVGVSVEGKITLPLLSTGVGCVTCHDPAAPTTDKRSWRSQSLFARWFQSQPTYKTYYLRINNSQGALCQACH